MGQNCVMMTASGEVVEVVRELAAQLRAPLDLCHQLHPPPRARRARRRRRGLVRLPHGEGEAVLGRREQLRADRRGVRVGRDAALRDEVLRLHGPKREG